MIFSFMDLSPLRKVCQNSIDKLDFYKRSLSFYASPISCKVPQYQSLAKKTERSIVIFIFFQAKPRYLFGFFSFHKKVNSRKRTFCG